MDIPPYLNRQIYSGDCVLFLGSGASRDAVNKRGENPPLGGQLGAMISDHFLGGKFKQNQLNQIGELAISESSLVKVQSFIRDVFSPFESTAAHNLLPKFKWAGLATTNYDLLVEKAYESVSGAGQTVKPFIENGDQVNDIITTSDSLKYLKLHGCITRIENPDCPLILTTDQYIEHLKGRSRIFNHLIDLAFEKPIVFIGHSLQDPDIRAILIELQRECKDRHRFYIVAPIKDPIEKRFWEGKKITSIDGGFGEFMKTLFDGMSPSMANLMFATPQSQDHPIYRRFKRLNGTLSRNCIQFLENDAEYVQGIECTVHSEAKEFYRGYTKGWHPIEQSLDVRRALGDTVLSDHVLCTETQHIDSLEVVLIKAHAGAGKSVLLRRIAWDAAKDYDKLVLYVKEGGVISTAALEELANLCSERIYLFIDDLGDRVRELVALARFVKSCNCKITIIAAERVNEWNVLGDKANQLITTLLELKYLSEKETNLLIELLATHGALGTLEAKSKDDRMKAFQAHAGRQLLVALHEATLGRPFEDIIEDEYNHIVPDGARRLYLSICVLNRLSVPVRAGIVSRLHGISFDDFKQTFLNPLENVVHAELDPKTHDIAYEARHPVIAEIVFERALKTQEERYDAIVKLLSALNIDYTGDRKAFRSMTRGRAILELFPNCELAERVYKVAHSISQKDGTLFHQEGICKMHVGDLESANELFSVAERLSRSNLAIKHSRSELLLKMADKARTQLEREAFLREATSLAKSLKGDTSQDAYADHTLVKIGLNRLKPLLEDVGDEPGGQSIAETVRTIQKHLSEGLAKRPGDSYLHSADSELATLLKDSSRAVSSLRKAFEANSRAAFLAIRLASHYEGKGELSNAKAVLTKALEESRTDKALHFRFARHLMLDATSSGETLAYHLERSFTPGDSNYDAQLLFGRQLYLNGERNKHQEVFNRLKRADVDFETRDKLLFPLSGTFRGVVERIEAYYLVIRRDGPGDTIFAQRRDSSEETWRSISQGVRIEFRIAFNFHGPGAEIIGLVAR